MMQRDDRCNIMDIVKMDADNVAVVAQIEMECFSKPWSEDMLKSELHNPNSYFIVAKLNDKILDIVNTQAKRVRNEIEILDNLSREELFEYIKNRRNEGFMSLDDI